MDYQIIYTTKTVKLPSGKEVCHDVVIRAKKGHYGIRRVEFHTGTNGEFVKDVEFVDSVTCPIEAQVICDKRHKRVITTMKKNPKMDAVEIRAVRDNNGRLIGYTVKLRKRKK